MKSLKPEVNCFESCWVALDFTVYMYVCIHYMCICTYIHTQTYLGIYYIYGFWY